MFALTSLKEPTFSVTNNKEISYLKLKNNPETINIPRTETQKFIVKDCYIEFLIKITGKLRIFTKIHIAIVIFYCFNNLYEP